MESAAATLITFTFRSKFTAELRDERGVFLWRKKRVGKGSSQQSKAKRERHRHFVAFWLCTMCVEYVVWRVNPFDERFP